MQRQLGCEGDLPHDTQELSMSRHAWSNRPRHLPQPESDRSSNTDVDCEIHTPINYTELSDDKDEIAFDSLIRTWDCAFSDCDKFGHCKLIEKTGLVQVGEHY